jgi:hypothetical protein
VRFFDLRADYWIDDEREDPVESDIQSHMADARPDGPDHSGILRTSQGRFQQKLRSFILSHREEWERYHGPLDRQEKELLGIREETDSELKGEPVGEQKGIATSE